MPVSSTQMIFSGGSSRTTETKVARSTSSRSSYSGLFFTGDSKPVEATQDAGLVYPKMLCYFMQIRIWMPRNIGANRCVIQLVRGFPAGRRPQPDIPGSSQPNPRTKCPKADTKYLTHLSLSLAAAVIIIQRFGAQIRAVAIGHATHLNSNIISNRKRSQLYIIDNLVTVVTLVSQDIGGVVMFQ